MIIRSGLSPSADVNSILLRSDNLIVLRFEEQDDLVREYHEVIRPALLSRLSTDVDFRDRLFEMSDEELGTLLSHEVCVSRFGVSKSHPYATIGLIVFCCIMFGVELIVGDGSVTIDSLVLLGGRVNSLVQQGDWWRLVMPIFLHGGLVHLLCNMLVLHNLGDLTERLNGSWKFVVVFLLAGLAGTFSGYAFADPRVVSIGASGAIFGLFGALVAFRVRYGKSRFSLFIDDKAFFRVLGFNLLLGLVMFTMIDNYAHIGGLVGGYLAGEIVGFSREKFRLRNYMFMGIYLFAMIWLFGLGSAR
ncbi:rhomboid family intramembrane serine protease [Candidatus Sumerlaeota bacterium]|nr:rhomboid family intramembrane serine protease [Candidatus Sumerlaeota bacterium]